MSLLVLAFGLLLGSGSGASSLSVPAVPKTYAAHQGRSATREPRWARIPGSPPNVALVRSRFSRRASTTRVERSASLPGARLAPAPRLAWSPLQRFPDQRTAARHRAAALDRGPPPVL
jgi:hypothetical protein